MTRVVLITGSSRGIGAATALLAAERGYAVGVNYRHNKDAAEAVVAKIEQAGGKAVALAADVSKEAEVERLFHEVDEKLGKLDALINNAGILEKQMRLEAMKGERLERIFGTNISGSFLCAREAVKRMSTRNSGAGGVIINLTSAAVSSGAPGEYIDYAASKGAIDVFTKGLAKEVAAEGIRVNAVRPGLIYTDIHADGGEPERVDRLKAGVPMGRGGTAKEIANAILWLLSDEASYVTGSCIDVTGGR